MTYKCIQFRKLPFWMSGPCDIAPPGQEGWTRHQEKHREASFDGADGVVVQDQTEMFLNLNHHPVCAASDASHFLPSGAATPPGQEGRWPGPPSS